MHGFTYYFVVKISINYLSLTKHQAFIKQKKVNNNKMIISQPKINKSYFNININKQTKIITSINHHSVYQMSQQSKATQQNIYHLAAKNLTRSFSVQSFERFFINSRENFQQLSRIIKECNIDDIHCRFNVWRLCLGVVSVDSTKEKKLEQILLSREKYQQKKDEALKSLSKKSPIKQPVKKNPLLMMSSPKVQQHKQMQTDQFLKEQIHKDVERTYQEMKFFQEKTIQKLLNLILFVWCRRNPDVSYKQGMNQLLASVVVCYFKQAEFKSREEKPQNITQQLWNEHFLFNSVEYAESDIYSVFEKIIDIQGNMYKTEADLTIKNKVNPNSKNNTSILQRIMQIKDHKLKHMDLQLFRILKLQGVLTNSFMLRWIRCMHTREFDLENSFVIWDSIFLEFLQSDNSKKYHQFEFIDAMCLAMFMYMRSIVFTKETAGEILQVYQKYPALKRGVYLDELITLAWTICEQLRNEHQNIQASQTNWFQDSSKVKALHFMEKKQEKKTLQQQGEVKQKQFVKKPQKTQKQLKETDHKKHPQISKKHPQPLHKQKDHHTQGQNEQKTKTQNNHSNEIIKQIPTDKHKSTPVIEKQSVKELVKNTSVEESVKVQANVQAKHAKEEKHQNTHTSIQHQHPYTLHTKQASTKIPDNVSISLSHLQITQLLENLNESLPKVRDIDAQSLIRRTIKKIESKVKQAKEEEVQKMKIRKASKQRAKNMSENGDIVLKDK